MERGAFSVSLAVKDIEASKALWGQHDLGSRRKLYWPGERQDCGSRWKHDSGVAAWHAWPRSGNALRDRLASLSRDDTAHARADCRSLPGHERRRAKKPLVLAGASGASTPTLVIAILSASGLVLSLIGRRYADS
jgi:hypothetical protein